MPAFSPDDNRSFLDELLNTQLLLPSPPEVVVDSEMRPTGVTAVESTQAVECLSLVCTADSHGFYQSNGLWVPIVEQSPQRHDYSPTRVKHSLLEVIDDEIRPITEPTSTLTTESEVVDDEIRPIAESTSILTTESQWLRQKNEDICLWLLQSSKLCVAQPIETALDPQHLESLLMAIERKTTTRKEMSPADRMKDNELSYDRYSHRLSLERGARDGLIETDLRVSTLDRLMPARKEFTAVAMRKAVAVSARVRSNSHNGRWDESQLSEEEVEDRKWFNLVEVPDNNLDMLSPIKQSITSSDTYFSLVPWKMEEELELRAYDNKLFWQRGFVIKTFDRSGKTTCEFEIFTLQGFRRIKSTQEKDFRGLRIKYARLSNGEAVVRCSSHALQGCIFKVEDVDKKNPDLLRIKTTAVIAYKDPSSTANWLMWCDDIGLIEVSRRDMIQFVRPHIHCKPTTPPMAHLRVVEIRMKTRISEDSMHSYVWVIENMSMLNEEDEEKPLDDSVWPRLAQRVDDLEWVNTSPEGVLSLHSPTFPDRIISCEDDQWLRKELDDESLSYWSQKLTAVIVPHKPHFGGPRARRWKCLIFGALSYLSVVTDDRILNFRSMTTLIRSRRNALPKEWYEGNPVSYHISPYDTESM